MEANRLIMKEVLNKNNHRHSINILNILRLKLIVFCSIAFAMNGGCAIDTSLAYKYHFKADSSFQNIDTCFKYTTLAIPLLEKIEDWDKYQYDLNCLSYCYQHLEKYDEMLANNIFALSEATLLTPVKLDIGEDTTSIKVPPFSPIFTCAIRPKCTSPDITTIS